MWEMNPHMDCSGDIAFRIKVWGPSIQIQTPGVEEIWIASKNKIPVLFVLKKESVETFTIEEVIQILFDEGFLVLRNPEFHLPR